MKKAKKHKIYKIEKGAEITKEFVDVINDLLSHLSPNNYTVDKKRLGDLLSNDLLEIFVLEADGRIAGMGSLHFVDTLVKKAAWLEDIVVHPEHRGKGFGKKITDHLIGRAKKKKVKHIDLTSRNDREKAHAFYEKMNFEKRNSSIFRLKTKKK